MYIQLSSQIAMKLRNLKVCRRVSFSSEANWRWIYFGSFSSKTREDSSSPATNMRSNFSALSDSERNLAPARRRACPWRCVCS